MDIQRRGDPILWRRDRNRETGVVDSHSRLTAEQKRPAECDGRKEKIGMLRQNGSMNAVG